MTNVCNNMVECDSCRKKISKFEARKLFIKGCCGSISVPLCKDCWKEVHQKKD